MDEKVSQFSIKYRPLYFKDVFGQDNVVKAIQKRSKENKFPQSILLQGQFGIGKTTLAFIIAAAMNKRDKNGEPDWECPDNKAILNQSFSRDTILLDASRWSGKDDIIEFTNVMKSRPMYSESGIRIFIIEEIDQASTAAKLSLLKILEKPDPYNKFILLSMESNGVPNSIKSRCQVYNLKPISIKDMMMAMRNVLVQSGDWENLPVSFKTEGLACIANNSKGSLRTAIQNLEACIEGQLYNPEDIEGLIGTTDEASTYKILEGLLKKSRDETMWGTIYKSDPQEIYNYLTLILSNVMIYKNAGYIDDERFESSIRGMSNNPNVKSLFNILSRHPQLCKPYMRKADLLSALAEYYNKETVTERVVPTRQVRR